MSLERGFAPNEEVTKQFTVGSDTSETPTPAQEDEEVFRSETTRNEHAPVSADAKTLVRAVSSESPIFTDHTIERVDSMEEHAEATPPEFVRDLQKRLGDALVGVAPDGKTFLPDDQRAAMLIDVAEQAFASGDAGAERVGDRAVDALTASFGAQEDADLQERIDALRAARPHVGQETKNFLESVADVQIPSDAAVEELPLAAEAIPSEYVPTTGVNTSVERRFTSPKERGERVEKAVKPEDSSQVESTPDTHSEILDALELSQDSYVAPDQLSHSLDEMEQQEGLSAEQRIATLETLLAESASTERALIDMQNAHQDIYSRLAPNETSAVLAKRQSIKDQMVNLVRFQIRANGVLKTLHEAQMAQEPTRIKRVG